MDSFIGIRFKKETAKRFQEFSKTHFNSHTEAMAEMLDFFLYNEITPKEKLGPTGRTIEASLKKRMNAIIAILRDIEKTQTKPTAAMMELLFQSDDLSQPTTNMDKDLKKETKEVRFKEKLNFNK